MPRLSHTFDITHVERDVVDRTVASAYEVARSCRFDDHGWLLTPDEATRARLTERAEELGLVDRERSEQLRREQHEAAEELRYNPPQDPERAEELAVKAASSAVRLQSGQHLQPGSYYLVTELTPDGRQLEAAAVGKGWVGGGLTVDEWDEAGVCSVGFALPDTVGTVEDPVTSGSLNHDSAAGLLTGTVRIQLPGRGAWLRRATGTLTVDAGAWYAALQGHETGVPPALLEATHRLVTVRAWLSPRLDHDGRWSVEAVLQVRGRGLVRPFVAMAVWAVRKSMQREESKSAREGAEEPNVRKPLDQTEEDCDRIARNASSLPDFLHEVAQALDKAPPRI